VIIDVITVIIQLETVQFVLKTEPKNQLVIVQMELIKLMDKLLVQIVKSNVELVKVTPNTVPNVLMVSLTHQNVHQLHMKENLLESLISQSDPLKSSLAETVVKPVLDTEITVKFVQPTDLTHHIVDVLPDISKISMKKPVPNVNLVDTCVILVPMLTTTVAVHVLLTESSVQLVSVLMELLMIT